jgi:uncharacterized repeat protein (TIGR02543 family)
MLAGTSVWAKSVANAGYNTPTLKHGTTTMTASGSSFTVGATETITSGATANIYKITLDNQEATTAGTQETWYRYKSTSVVSGTTCYYYTNSSLTTCLSGGYTISKPEKTGYTFKGYYTAVNGGGTQYITSAGAFTNNLYNKMPSSDINTLSTLYAKWTPLSYTLTITPGTGTTITVNRQSSTGGGATGNLSSGATIYYGDVLKISVSANTGYTSASVKVNNSAFTSGNNHTVSGNVTVTSTASKIKYTITFNANGGSVSPTSKQADYNTAWGSLPTPTYAGYNFNGWYTNTNWTTQVTSSSVATANITVVAKWTSKCASGETYNTSLGMCEYSGCVQTGVYCLNNDGTVYGYLDGRYETCWMG